MKRDLFFSAVCLKETLKQFRVMVIKAPGTTIAIAPQNFLSISLGDYKLPIFDYLSYTVDRIEIDTEMYETITFTVSKPEGR